MPVQLRTFFASKQWISPTWGVVAAGITAAAFAWTLAERRVEADATSAARTAVENARDEIEARLVSAYDVLYGVQGLFRASDHVSRTAFNRYVAGLHLTERHPGMRGIAYGELVRAHDKAKLEGAVRGDRTLDSAGYPDFTIRPTGERAQYLPIVYIEPMVVGSLGLDLLTSERMESVERARDRGRTVVSRRLTLASDPQHQPAVIVRLAVYRNGMPTGTLEERRAAFSGVISATFIVSNLVGDILSRPSIMPLEVALHDRIGVEGSRIVGAGPASDLLFEKPAPTQLSKGERGYFSGVLAIDLGGRNWHLTYAGAARAFVTPTDRMLPWIALFGVLLVTGLLASLVRSLASSRERARRLATRMTEDLRQSEAQLTLAQKLTEAMIEALPNPIFFKDTEGRYQGVNKAWESFFGLARGSCIGKTVYDLYPADRALAERLDAGDRGLLARQGTLSYERVIDTHDGLHHDTVIYKATYPGADAAVAGLIGTIIDITERKQVERRQAMEHAITTVLAAAESLDLAIPKIIQTICETMGWHYGDRYEYDPPSGLLIRREVWAVDTPDMQAFADAAAHRSTRPDATGTGLVRRTYAAGKVVWITDVSKNQGLQRQALIEKAGLRGALAFPLVAGGVTLGVMEFFHRDVREPDATLIAIAASIGTQIGQFTVRMQAEEAVKFVAMHDSLTGLPNRVMFNKRLEQALAQAQRHERGLAVMFIDLDRFKIINDTLGHESGDVLLRDVAQRLTDQLRLGDMVARLGGDEFVVLLDDVGDVVGVGVVADKIIGALAASFKIAEREVHVSGSIGIATYPADAQDMRTLMKYADIAMYRAKEQGRNTFQFYSDQINVNSLERLTLESRLRGALGRDEFVVHYQPIVESKSGAIVGMEALVRWQHRDGELLAPGQFIGIAEDTGLIVPIGQWVLQTACEQQCKWLALGLPPLRMAVNLSPRQFVHRSLVEDVVRVLEATGIDGRCLELEITESIVMHNAERATVLLAQLKERGVRIAIDDFGTGYSSLAYLKRFPIDTLKIDRSFVAEVPGDRGDTAITLAVIAMAHSLDLNVVAEGVETIAQLEFLREHGCEEMQGYYFSKPLSASDATAFLQKSQATSLRAVSR